jgi:effector-binding domain-containing protein
MEKRWMVTFGIIGIIFIGVIIVGIAMSHVETPNYNILDSKNNIEIRQYNPMIIAEVQVVGKREEVISDGFRLLADYIFGNNIIHQDIAMTAPVQQQKNSKISMTSPVQQQKSTKISMTSPVQQQVSGDTWKISFIMPSKYNMETLPKPINNRILIKEIASKKFIAIRFSGINSDQNIQNHEEKLMTYIENNKLSFTGPVKYAFYNPPWTPAFMRRNEVMIEIK